MINLYVDLVNDEDAILVLESLPNLEYLNGHETREIQDNDEQDEQQQLQQDVLPQVNEIIESNTNSNERDTVERGSGGYNIEHVEQIIENEHEEETNDNNKMSEHNNININNDVEYLSHSNDNNSNNIVHSSHNDNCNLNSDNINNNTNELHTAQHQGNTFNNEQHIDSLESEIPNFNVSTTLYTYII